jgi:hypothetical protein
MDRYVVVEEQWTSASQPDIWRVVDLGQTTPQILATCTDIKTTADKIAQALNDLDGGPLE